MIRILYIEDDSAHIELTHRSLENSGVEFNLQTAPTITDAFSLLKDNDYDVILSDYRLPDGSGLDVIRIAHEQKLSTAIVLITNQEDINTAIAALKGNRRYLGYEIEADYVRLAEKRIRQFILEFKSPSLLDLMGEDS